MYWVTFIQTAVGWKSEWNPFYGKYKKNAVQFGLGAAFDFISATLGFTSGFANESEFATVRYA